MSKLPEPCRKSAFAHKTLKVIERPSNVLLMQSHFNTSNKRLIKLFKRLG